jgi:hypothetical protein
MRRAGLVMLCVAACGGGKTETAGAGGNVTPGDASIVAASAAGAQFFVPRIVAEDASTSWWKYRQKTTIFWFGRVDSKNNYTQVRLGYGDSSLQIRCSVFDQKIYDASTDDAVKDWDGITLYLDLDGSQNKTAIDGRSLRIDAQAHRHGTERTVVYQGESGAWVKSAIEIGTDPDATPDLLSLMKEYRGGDADASRGWGITFFVAWKALGLSGPPVGADTGAWRAALVSYDRDSADGTVRGEPQYWPAAAIKDTDPSTWGTWQLLDAHWLSWAESGAGPTTSAPAYTITYQAPAYVAGTEQTVRIREGLDGEHVENAAAGGSWDLCPGDDAYNFGDGANSWGGHTGFKAFLVEDQEDYADWPCYGRIYVKFPLAKVPAGKVIVSARLILTMKQPTGKDANNPDLGEHSLIQVFATDTKLADGTEWTKDNLTWNLAPLATTNNAGVWGGRAGLDQGWDNLPKWTWDVGRLVAAAEQAGQTSASFALYSADTDMHTGKELTNSADFPDWGDANQRPMLEIVYADAK